MNKLLPVVLLLLMPLGLRAADFSRGDRVTLTRDLPLLFNDTVYRDAKAGDVFTVYSYSPTKHKVFILAQDPQGQTIALNIPDDSLSLDNPPPVATPSPTPSETTESTPEETPSPLPMPAPASESLGQTVSDNPGIVFFIIAGALGILIWAVSEANKRERIRKIKKKLEIDHLEMEVYFDNVKANHCIPAVDTRLHLKNGEIAVYEAPAKLYETRAVRNYQSGRASFRVAKGVWVGGSQGHSVSSQVWREIDSGTLTVTSKRIVFEGNQENRNALLGKILSTSSWVDAVEIFLENRQKALVFSARNPTLVRAIIEFTMTLT